MKSGYVYILTNRSKTLYTGVTSNLENRVFEHKNHWDQGFTDKYKIDRLVYFERFEDIPSAIAREKQIKGMTRLKKMALIVSMNPEWRDLSQGWYTRHRYAPDPRPSQGYFSPAPNLPGLAPSMPPGGLPCSRESCSSSWPWRSPGCG